MSMSNPLFDDFIELDLLDPSDASNDMYSFYLQDQDQGQDACQDEDMADSSHDLNSMAPLSPLSPTDTLTSGATMGPMSPMTTSTSGVPSALATATAGTAMSSSTAGVLPLVIKEEERDHDLLLPHHLKEEQESAQHRLVSPDQLMLAPRTMTPGYTSLASIATASAPAPTSAVLVDAPSSSSSSMSSPTLSTTSSLSKRSSPEPATSSTRKHPKTDSPPPKTKASAHKSSISSTSSSNSISALASTTRSTSSTVPPTTDPASAESLTSMANTTLSAATLQFLLQQQMQTPLIPQLFTGKLSREEIEATLARLLESTKHLIQPSEEPVQVKEEPVSDEESGDEMEGVEAEGAEQSHGLKTQPGIKTDDIPSSTDLKKMTSKERRQLRNKISARNFRVRRKEYIYTLEGQVLQHKTEARHLREAVTLVQEENQRLKDELELVQRQLAQVTIANGNAALASASQDDHVHQLQHPRPCSPNPLSKENQCLLTSIMKGNVSSALNPNIKGNPTLSMARPQSPILTPNYHKDVPNSSSPSTSQSPWKEKNSIMVHTTLVPEITLPQDFDFGSKKSKSTDRDDMLDRPWLAMDKVQEFDSEPYRLQNVVYELMKTFLSLRHDLTASAPTAAEEEAVLDLQETLWNEVASGTEEAGNDDGEMLEWLYESLVASLIQLDLQGMMDQGPRSSASNYRA